MVEAHRTNRYTLIVRDVFSRYTWVYVLCHKSCTPEIYKQFLPDARVDRVPSQVVTVRADGGGEFCGRIFNDLCRSICINQNITTVGSPQINGVAEPTLGLIEMAAMAVRIWLREHFPGAQLPEEELLWAEASHWACNALNRTETPANPANK